MGELGFWLRLRQRMCSHGRGRWVAGNVCTVCGEKFGRTPFEIDRLVPTD